ncbi:MAG: tetratricopeptide repeat protein [Planctomycetes bacterium]|nr:tetratricopeptide repeat protein [Planctomycetota bacterium]
MRRALVAAVLLIVIISAGAWLGSEAYAEAQFRQAQSALQDADFAAARGHLQCCLALRPNRFQFHFAAAQLQRRMGAFQSALHHLDRCQQLAGAGVDVSSLERTLLAAQQGAVLKVERPLWALVEQGHPETVLILEALARGYLHVYSLPLAEKSLKLLLEQRPQHAEGWFLRTGICEMTGPAADAVAFYRRALELRPSNDSYRLRLANFLIQLQRFEEARPHLEELCLRQPASSEALLGLARVASHAGERDRGRELVEKVLAIQPAHAQALVESARLDLDEGKLAHAQAALGRALEADPSDRACHYLLFQCLERLGNQKAARQQQARWQALESDLTRLEKIVRQDIPENPRSADLDYEMGSILARHGKAERALSSYRHALNCDPSHKQTHEALSRHLSQTGILEQAGLHQDPAAPPAAIRRPGP